MQEMLVNAITREFADDLELIPSTARLHLAALARTASVEEIASMARRALDAGVGIQMCPHSQSAKPREPAL